VREIAPALTLPKHQQKLDRSRKPHRKDRVTGKSGFLQPHHNFLPTYKAILRFVKESPGRP